MNILLISSVLPKNNIGGELLLYRHLSQWSTLHLVIATENSEGLQAQKIIKIQANPLLTRLKKTRLSKWANDICQCFDAFYEIKGLRRHIKYKKPDLILTVAHGELCWLALRLSKEFNLPLVTFFHDWWPDFVNVHSWGRGVLTNRFQQLYQHSKLAFCVSEEMRQALGKHPNARVLFPIAEQFASEGYPVDLANSKMFTVVYAGNLSDIYAPMMQALCTAIQEVSEFQLNIFGPQPDWSNELVQQVKDQGIYGGFLSKTVLYKVFHHQAHAFLLGMSFNKQKQRRTQVSFPTKLLEYIQFGKPIIIWGPEYCSAVRWGRKYKAALVVTSPSAEDLIQAIINLANEPDEQKRLRNKALEIAKNMFNPQSIQLKFIESIQEIIDSPSQRKRKYAS